MKLLALYNQYVTRIVAVLAAICALSVFAYGTFLLLAVAHAAGITEAQAESRDLTAKIGMLDATYLQETQALTPATAQALGFVKPTDVAVVYTQSSDVLTFNR